MDNSYRDSVEEIKTTLKKLEKSSGLKFIFFAVIAVCLITLAVVLLVLKLKSGDKYDIYEDFDEDDADVYPFDEDEYESEDESPYKED